MFRHRALQVLLGIVLTGLPNAHATVLYELGSKTPGLINSSPCGAICRTTDPVQGNVLTVRANDGNFPGNAVDNDLSTRWSANGNGQSLTLDLGTARTVSFVRIAAYQGTSRRNSFDLQVSTDGTAWTNVLTGAMTSGTTAAEETFDFTDRPARYVRYLGHGNSVNTWNSVSEMSVFAP
jgi:poly(beta-D-mannuronate) lyase